MTQTDLRNAILDLCFGYFERNSATSIQSNAVTAFVACIGAAATCAAITDTPSPIATEVDEMVQDLAIADHAANDAMDDALADPVNWKDCELCEGTGYQGAAQEFCDCGGGAIWIGDADAISNKAIAQFLLAAGYRKESAVREECARVVDQQAELHRERASGGFYIFEPEHWTKTAIASEHIAAAIRGMKT